MGIDSAIIATWAAGAAWFLCILWRNAHTWQERVKLVAAVAVWPITVGCVLIMGGER